MKIDWAQDIKGFFYLPQCTNDYFSQRIDPEFMDDNALTIFYGQEN